jgi:hypothetical protein
MGTTTNGAATPAQSPGLLTKLFHWGTSAGYSDTAIQEWLWGLLLVLILSFLWSTVVRQVVD